MSKSWNIALGIVLGLVIYELIIQTIETLERHTYWRRSREYCDKVKKPLLRVGMKRSIFEPPNGDVTIDLDKAVLKIPGGVLGDERHMPFIDKQFGVCFNEHTLEHLHSVKDVELAVRECTRIADCAVFLTPSPYSIVATFFCKTHRLRIWSEDDKIAVQELGLTPVGRAIVTYGQPPKVEGVEENELLSGLVEAMGGRPIVAYERGYEESKFR